MESLVDQLLQAGTMGLFAAFLVWQHLGMQKRFDALTADFQATLKEINDDYDQRIEKMRERYDVVIREAKTETNDQAREFMAARIKVQTDIVSKLDKLLDRVDG